MENSTQWGNYFQSSQTVAGSATNTNPKNDTSANPSGTTSGDVDIQKAGQIAASGNTLGWWLAILAVFVGLTFFIEKFDAGSTFGNVKLSAYNMLIIGVNAVLFIVLVKYLATRFPIPGLGAIALAV